MRVFGLFALALTILLGGVRADAAGKFALSFKEFKALSQENRVAYVQSLVRTIAELEAAQKRNSKKTSSNFRLPGWILEQAYAQQARSCFYAGHIGTWRNNQCVWPTDVSDTVCGKVGGIQQKPCQTVPVYLPQKSGANAGKPYCVMPFNNATSTPAEECEAKMRQDWGKDWAKELAKKIIEGGQDTERSFARVETVVNDQCPEQEGQRWCSRQSLYVSAIRNEVDAQKASAAAASRSEAERTAAASALAAAQAETTRVRTELTTVATQRDELQRTVEQQGQQLADARTELGNIAEANKRCRDTKYLEENNPVFCQMKAKGENKYYSVRYTGTDKKELELWTSDSPTGEWCRRGTDETPNAKFTSDGNRDAKDVTNQLTKKKEKCELKRFKIETKAIAGGKLPGVFQISQDAYNTNECRIDVNEGRGEKKPETEDFVMGVDTTKAPFTRATSESFTRSKPESVVTRILRDAEKSGRDAFRFRDQDVGCPDETTKNLAYALTALQGYEQCLVREPQVVPQTEAPQDLAGRAAAARQTASEVGEDESDLEDYRVNIKTNLGNEGSYFRLKFRSYGDNKEGQKSVRIRRTHARMTVDQWLNGDNADDEFALLNVVKQNSLGACRDTVKDDVRIRTGGGEGIR